MSTPEGVPLAYRDVWRRALYAGEGEDGGYAEDRETWVVWLQTAHWHADLQTRAASKIEHKPGSCSVHSMP